MLLAVDDDDKGQLTCVLSVKEGKRCLGFLHFIEPVSELYSSGLGSGARPDPGVPSTRRSLSPSPPSQIKKNRKQSQRPSLSQRSPLHSNSSYQLPVYSSRGSSTTKAPSNMSVATANPFALLEGMYSLLTSLIYLAKETLPDIRFHLSLPLT